MSQRQERWLSSHPMGTQGAALLVVLFDSGVFVVKIERVIDIGGEHPGAEVARCAPSDSPAGDKLQSVRTPEVEMVSYSLLIHEERG